MIAKCIDNKQKNWDTLLPGLAFSYNASVHESTGQAPFFLMHGFLPRWDCDLQVGTQPRERYSTNDYADLLVTNLDTAHQLARDHLQTTALRMKSWYDKRVNAHNFAQGEKVKVLNLRLYPGKTNKWMLRFSDVATVIQRINDVTYRLKCDKWSPPEKIVHVDKIRPILAFVPAYGDPTYVQDPDGFAQAFD